jgi:hypothetical protein
MGVYSCAKEENEMVRLRKRINMRMMVGLGDGINKKLKKINDRLRKVKDRFISIHELPTTSEPHRHQLIY